MQKIPELVCPAGNLPALKTAVDNGADTVYMGLKDATNARNFPGLNFDMKSAREGVAYAHARGRNVLMAINTFAQAGQVERWHAAVDTAADLGADAIYVADPAIMAYAADKHPEFTPAYVGTRFGHQLRSHQYDEGTVRHPSCRFTACTDHRSGQTCD